MDDSDQDFVDLCSKLLKRVRKKPGESRQPRRAEHQPSSQPSYGDKRRRNNRTDGLRCAWTQPACAGSGSGGTGHDSGDPGSSGGSAAAGPGPGLSLSPGPGLSPKAQRSLTAKDKVLQKMQQFRRSSPQRMMHREKSQSTNHEDEHVPPPHLEQRQDPPAGLSSAPPAGPGDSDEALALLLQQELDREAAEVRTVDLEDGGLFFCQICQRDLSHMSPEGRTQHLNRCLDESETSARAPSPPPPAPPPPAPPGVPDCPICGKRFKSQKSRSAHLKRCSSDMGVPPAVLLQALQRQAEETQNVTTANSLTETGGTKRKGPSKPGVPAKKRPRKKNEALDEETLVALALSSSLLDQERAAERLMQTETDAPLVSVAPVLKWKPDAGKGRGKRRKLAVSRPPPLLLVQDADSALMRLQERVAALLLRGRAPSPPTPARRPSSLPGLSGAAPLWEKSKLLDACLLDFYVPELREFITPWEPAATDAASISTVNKPESSATPANGGASVRGTRASVLPSSSSQTALSSPASSTPGTGKLPVSSQVLRDLMDLAEDGMTLTQYGLPASDRDKEKSSGLTSNLRLSGFVLQESEEAADLCASGFLPETTHTHTDETHSRARTTANQTRGDEERSIDRPVAPSRLASDLSSMVNNPQLSDVQIQVDSGDVFFTHSFMLYARCPLLAEMVHESGFGVQEEGLPAAQRVLMSDVPGRAVFLLLQYLYTADCCVPASLRPHVFELASRFDLQELQQLCRHEDAAAQRDEDDHVNQDVDNQTDAAFMELLRSMWNENEDEDNDGMDSDGGGDVERRGEEEEDNQNDDLTAADREICEEKVNEEELEEIYEFAATQKKKEEEKDDSVEEEVEEEEEKLDSREEDGEEVFMKPAEPDRSSTGLKTKKRQPNSLLKPDLSLDRSYNRLFSDSWGVYEDGDASTLPPKTHQTLQKPPPELSGRVLLQSSLSLEDVSLSPPPCSSNLPVPGQSPGLLGHLDVPKEGSPVKPENQRPPDVHVPLSPDSPQKKNDPELIVLSDSSDEMEVVLSSRSPSPCFPSSTELLQSFTQIKPQPTVTADDSTTRDRRSDGSEVSPDGPDVSPGQSHPGSERQQSPVDFSPEVSWLVPSTPLHHGRSSTSTCSTQTRSSMCRTRLFHKGSSSGSEPGETVPRSSSSGPTRTDVSKVREECSVPPFQPKHSHLCSSTSKQDTPLHLHLQPRPYSSTPLHMELHQPPGPPATSPLQHSSLHKQSSSSRGGAPAPSESPEKMEMESFHPSHLSDPSDPPSSSSQRDLQRSSECRRSRQSESQKDELTRSRRREDEGGESRSRNRSSGDGGEQDGAAGETGAEEAADSSFQQSFMVEDEPPIAFNDSWGLNDVCVDVNPGRFSLRLEDSRTSSQQEIFSPRRRETTRSSSSTDRQPSPSGHGVGLLNGHEPSDPTTQKTPEINNSLLDSKLWDSWEEKEEKEVEEEVEVEKVEEQVEEVVEKEVEEVVEKEVEEAPPLSRRVNSSAQLKTPAVSHHKRRRSLVPITPMPHFSDMDTPELKNKLNRFGVRPLPKRQMVLKLKEIHQFTHQLLSSDSEDEAPRARTKPPPPPPPGSKAKSCATSVKFKEPRAPPVCSPLKHSREEEEAELLASSQGSNASSTAASEESERSNPELCLSSDGDSDSDGGVSASQVASRVQDRLRAVRSFILSDPELYTQILQYRPLVLSQLQQRLKAAGIRLGAAKLADYLDSQCVTFTTAKPGHTAQGRGRTKKTAKAASENGVSRKRGVTATN